MIHAEGLRRTRSSHPATRTFAWRRRLDQPAGDLVPMAGDILALHDHPRLYAAATGNLIAEWPDLPTGNADSAIVWDNTFSGPARVAVDQTGNRFAVTDGDRITIVHLGWPAALNCRHRGFQPGADRPHSHADQRASRCRNPRVDCVGTGACCPHVLEDHSRQP